MPGSIRVTPEQLLVLSGSVARGSSQIDGLLGSLRGQVEPLVAADWSGQASAQFHALWQQWQSGARELNAALTGISQLLGRASASYEQAETQIAQSFTGSG